MRYSWISLASYLPFVMVSTLSSATSRRGPMREIFGWCQKISSSSRSPAMQDGNYGYLAFQIIVLKEPMSHSGSSQSAPFTILTPRSYKKVQSVFKVNWKPVFSIMENVIVSSNLTLKERFCNIMIIGLKLAQMSSNSVSATSSTSLSMSAGGGHLVPSCPALYDPKKWI